MEVPVYLGDLDLTGQQVGQAGGRLRRVDLLHFGPVRGLAPVILDSGVKEISANTKLTAFVPPGTGANRTVDVSGLTFRVPLVLAVYEVVALLCRDDEIHCSFGAQQVELHRVVIDYLDVLVKFVSGLPEQSAEQPGVGGNGLFTDNQGGGVGNVVRGELAPITVEWYPLPEAEHPPGAVGLGDFPFRCQARLQGAVEAVGMHQRFSKMAHLSVGRSSGTQPASDQFLYRWGHRNLEASTHGFRLLGGRRSVGRPRRGGGYDGGNGGGLGGRLRRGRGSFSGVGLLGRSRLRGGMRILTTKPVIRDTGFPLSRE